MPGAWRDHDLLPDTVEHAITSDDAGCHYCTSTPQPPRGPSIQQQPQKSYAESWHAHHCHPHILNEDAATVPYTVLCCIPHTRKSLSRFTKTRPQWLSLSTRTPGARTTTRTQTSCMRKVVSMLVSKQRNRTLGRRKRQ